MIISWALSSQGNWLQHVRCVIPLAIMWLGRNEARYEGSPLVARWLIDRICGFFSSLGAAKFFGLLFL